MAESAPGMHPYWSRSRPAMLALVCLLAAGCAYHYFAWFLPNAHAARASRALMGQYTYGNDLHPIWLSTHELFFHRADPYSDAMSARNQIAIYGRVIPVRAPDDSIQGVYPYPLYTSFLVAPLAPLSFPAVQMLGEVLFPAFVIAGVLLWVRNLRLRWPPTALLAAILLTLASFPVLEGIYALQIGLLVAALLAGTVFALVKGRLAAAGFLLALASVKPQLILPVSLWLLLWAASDLSKRKTFIISLLASTTALVTAGELLLPGWITSWIQALRQYRQHNHPPLAQIVLGRTAGDAFSIALVALTAMLLWRTRREAADSPRFVAMSALVLAVTVPILPSSIAVYDHLLLAPAIFWCVSVRSEIFGGMPMRILGWATVAVLCWQWVAGAGVALLTLLHPAIVGSGLILLPVRAAASVPFAVAGLSLWVAWKRATPARSPAPSG